MRDLPMYDPLSHPSPAVAEAIAAVEAGAVRRTSPSGDGEMVWRVWGYEGGPRTPVVLLHGGYGSWLHWIRTVPLLSRDRAVYVADLPGLGESAPPPDRRDPDSIGRTVAEGIRTVLPRGRDYHLVGFSFGAIIGGHASQFLDGRQKSLVLVGAGGMGLPRGDAPLVKFTRDMPVDEVKAMARRNLEILMLRDPAEVDDFAVEMQVINTLRAVTKSRWISRADTLAGVLPRLDIPLAGIWGEFDSTAWPHVDARAEMIRRLCPGAPFRVVPEAGHWVMYERAEPFHAALADVLAELEGARAA